MPKLSYMARCISMSALAISAMPAFADDSQEIASLRAEVAEMRAAMKANTSAPAAKKADGYTQIGTGTSSAKFYGFIRGDMIHDFQAAPPEIFSDLHLQPLKKDNGIKNTTQFTPNTSRLGVDFKSSTAIGEVTGKIETDFWGGSGGTGNTLRMRHAYFTVNNWLIGHTWSPFSSVQTLPEVVDFDTPVGGSLRRKAQVRYTQALSSNDTVMVALEDPRDGTLGTNSRLPVLSAKVEHKFADNKGLVNFKAVGFEKRNTSDTAKGYAVGVGAMYQAAPATKLYGQYSHVNGDGNFGYGGGVGYSIQATTNKILLDEFDTAMLGITQQLNPKLRGTLAVSWIGFKDDSVYAKDAANSSKNKDLKQASINLIYAPVPNINIGGEYTYGEREVFSGDKGTQSRINLMGKYSF